MRTELSPETKLAVMEMMEDGWGSNDIASSLELDVEDVINLTL